MTNTKTQHKCAICNEHLTSEQLAWWNEQDERGDVYELTGEILKMGSVFCCSKEHYSEFCSSKEHYSEYLSGVDFL